MKVPTIDHPTNQPNFSIVEFGPIRLAFSYQTVIGFYDWRNAQRGWRVAQNIWSQTTGKHLSHLDGGLIGSRACRLDSADFELELGQALEGLEDSSA